MGGDRLSDEIGFWFPQVLTTDELNELTKSSPEFDKKAAQAYENFVNKDEIEKE